MKGEKRAAPRRGTPLTSLWFCRCCGVWNSWNSRPNTGGNFLSLSFYPSIQSFLFSFFCHFSVYDSFVLFFCLRRSSTRLS